MGANTVTAWTFRSASGAVGPVGSASAPPPPPPPSGYVVNPLAFWASDTANNTATFPASQGYTVPYSQSAFKTNMDANVRVVRQYYYDRLGTGPGGVGGYTFDAAPSQLFVSARSTADIAAAGAIEQYFTIKIALTEIVAAGSLAGVSDTDVRQLNFLIMPVPVNNFGYALTCNYTAAEGAFVSASNIQTVPPLVCASWNQASAFGDAPGTWTGAPRPDSFNTLMTEFARLYFAHELGHAFGYDALTQLAMGHTDSTNNLMRSSFDVPALSSATLNDTQIARILKSPFVTFHASRP